MGAREPYFDVDQLTRESFKAYLRPPPLLSCAIWADQYRQIAKGPEKGPWRTSRTPYLREPMECTDPEHPAQKVVMQFATQLGKSEVTYNAVLKRIHIDPMDMLFVQPTLNDAKDHSRQRFSPTVRRMRCLDDKLAAVRSRDEQNTWQTKEIRGGATLFFAGANSARSLASKPLPFAACDEVDGYPLDVDGEGDPIGLVWERLSNFPSRKLLMCSTPTVRDYSRVEREYLASDQRRFLVPCPHCGEWQHLIWGADEEHGIKWLKTESGNPRPETAVYICRACAAAIEENRHKTAMLEAGTWQAQNPDAWPRNYTAGFHLNKIYSPVGWKSWGMLVEDWTNAMEIAQAGDQSKLKTFVNTSLAETYEEQGEKADQHVLSKRAESWDYPLRLVHERCFVATLGVDVQSDRLEASIWGWGRGLERHLVDRATFYGDPAAPESDTGSPWAALTEYWRTPVLHPSGNRVPILAGLVDSGGHHTNQVYVYARNHQRHGIFACKGHSIAGKPIIGSTPSYQDVDYKGAKVKRGVQLWMIGTDSAKAEIYGRLRTSKPGPGYVHLSKQLPEEALDQLVSERLVTRYVKGQPKLEWVKPNGKRNEELDKAVYALAAAHKLQMERWREGDWRKWERRVVATVPTPQPPDPSNPDAPAPVAPPPEESREMAPPKVKGRRLRGRIMPSPGWG